MENTKGQNTERNEDLRNERENQKGAGNSDQNASATRGGTTDMDRSGTGAASTGRQHSGSGITTKQNVTGSDFDGQVTDQ